MPLNIKINKELVTKSARVKQVDFHPTENWIAAALYSGNLVIYDHALRSTIRTFVCSTYPLRTVKFIPRQKLVVCAGDDLQIRAFHLGSQELVSQFDAHNDYIRCLAVHPTEPWLLSSSDDTRIKLWNTETWTLITTFESHSHYIMSVVWHPTQNIFASASLDKTIKLWAVSNASLVSSPNYQLIGHKQGVNCVVFGPPESDMLISGGDDNVRVWNYASKQCLHVLEAHTSGINSVAIHPIYPLIISASEDTCVNTWNLNTFKLEQSLQFHMDRVWSAGLKGGDSCLIGFGTDQGTLVLEMGKNELIYSQQGGKLVICKGARVFMANLKAADKSLFDEGMRLTDLHLKELGSVDMFPQACAHHPSGRFLAICGEGEYIIATSQALRSKAFGNADDLVWSPAGDYCTLTDRNSRTKAAINIHRDFKSVCTVKLDGTVDSIYGGFMIAVAGQHNVNFHDWNSGMLIRSIEVKAKLVAWSPCSDYVAVVSQSSLYILRFDPDAIDEKNEYDPEEGYYGAFEIIGEIAEEATSLYWLPLPKGEIGGVLLYTTANMKLSSWAVGNYTEVLTFTPKPLKILEWIDGTLFLLDRQHNVINYSYALGYALFCLKTLNKQFDAASALLDDIDKKHYTRLAKFLSAQGHHEKAIEISQDDQHRLQLALELNQLDLAAEILHEQKSKASQMEDTSHLKPQWKTLGDAALSFNNKDLAVQSFLEAGDLESCLLIFTSLGDDSNTQKVAEKAMQTKQYNIAAIAYFHLNRAEDVLRAYMASGNIAYAVAFARTYCPEKVPGLLPSWVKTLGPRFKIEYNNDPRQEDTRKSVTEAAEQAVQG